MSFESQFLGLSGFESRRITFQPDRITITLSALSVNATCPGCGQTSSRVHSRYHRTIRDLPWHGVSVVLDLEVRKYFCDRSDCPRWIFGERLAPVAQAYGRHTLRLNEALRTMGFSLGGEAGSRLAGRLGMPVSGDTLLRRVRQTALPVPSDPHVVGIDDWALRRGYRYGTILCDLEAHRPVDLLADRDPEHVVTWFKAHPDLHVISRDRGNEYIHAANAGAPQAIQVADRWHLIHNLRDNLERILDRHPREIRQVAGLLGRPPAPTERPPPPSVPAGGQSTPEKPSIREVRRQRRRERYEKVIELYQKGNSFKAIARQVGLHHQTVAKYVRAGAFPERAVRGYSSRTEAFIDPLRDRWAEGCRNSAQLFREMRAQGFAGSYYDIRRRVAPWRTEPPDRSGSVPPRTVHVPSPSRIAGWLITEPAQRTAEDQRFLDLLQVQCPAVAAIQPLAQTFADLVRHRNVSRLDPWLAQVQAEGVPRELKGFGQGLQGDPAVQAALTLPWSNGQVEGQINRLKLIKRQMYGRANFDLLRQRVLYRG